MSTTITIKPIKGENFKVETQPEAKVADLKQKIAEARPDFPAEAQKLIHKGNILKDDSTVESIGIKPEEFIVVMVTKAKPAPAASPAPAAESSPAPAATPSPTPAPTPSPAGGAPDAGEQAAANVVSGSGVEGAIAQLCDMGFPRAEVERCLGAAFGNPDRAVEYLMNGIPEGVMREAAGGGGQAPPPGAAPGAGGDAGDADEPMGPGGAEGPVEIPPELAAIRDNPQFTQLAGMIAQNPQMMMQLLPALQQSHPQIAQAIQENPQAFLQMVAEVAGGGGQDPVSAMLAAAGQQGGGGGGAPPGQTVIRLTEEERAAVERLSAMGFDRNMAIQAYLACDKNEELAVNFLLENVGDAMDD
mmetsp:Transcript_49755/g.105964  ORF Transcript_49755/g.105964 Transcript_49755/m.105964 type:complete len:359 (-) Transcript_49755:176-1252(-)|eukprot:CAMPEP_0206455824 /NCGR_PEP_ID=MMETSP0324_2-20121206/22005_1 /ASSEMBLY_ACC=CAM_ASM_000836 /TAXON_ID=2866 /ORGANISM="Crypthecodinium cohnii, Strain Seligo" /LENGTH=358 /DNA_ID=CAMNT_0053926647 /DNA_START=67 /DNA_END=1143 /DNA_ORIENTATION=+